MHTMQFTTGQMTAATRSVDARAMAIYFYGYWFSRSGV